MASRFSIVALGLLVACAGSGKDDDTDTPDTTDTDTDTDTDTETGTSDTWWTETGGICTGSGLCLCPDATCGADAGPGDCDRDEDGCICAVANDSFGACPSTTGGSGHSGGSGSSTTDPTTTDPTTTDPTTTTTETGGTGLPGLASTTPVPSPSEPPASTGVFSYLLEVFGLR